MSKSIAGVSKGQNGRGDTKGAAADAAMAFRLNLPFFALRAEECNSSEVQKGSY